MQWGQSLSGSFLPHDAYNLPLPTANSQAYTVKLMQKGPPFYPRGGRSPWGVPLYSTPFLP